jgi:hypothetical protein
MVEVSDYSVCVLMWPPNAKLPRGNVTDRPRTGIPRKTTQREDWLISRRARQWPFSTADALRGNLAFGGRQTLALPSIGRNKKRLSLDQ